MRRSNHRLTVSVFSISLVLGLALSGCGGGGTDTVGGEDPPAVSGMLRKVTSATEFETSLKSSLQSAAANGAGAGPVVMPAVDASAFLTTNTVESGVDEFDEVRYDGSYLYVAGGGGFSEPQTIRILRTDAATGQAVPVSTITLAAGKMLQGLVVANGRLVVLTSEVYFMPFGALWNSITIWAPTRMAVHVYDVANPAQPRALTSAEIDGVFVASRRIDDRVYLVSRHTPRALVDPADRPQLAQMTLAGLLPKVRIAGRESALVNATNCYVTNDAERPGYPVITTITMFTLQDPGTLVSTCYNEPADGVYASRTALYISQPRLTGEPSAVTRIHKFALTNGGTHYSGSVEVMGSVWVGGQSDYRMNEQDGYLRVFTTEWKPEAGDGFDTRLYVLRQKAAEPALEVVGSLPNDLRPSEIGKPNERLYGVRFAGDRAYGITFQVVDPLYVFDLTNPADPRIAGELEIPGRSDYLHPVSADLLLGLGTLDGRIKLELFDASVISNPVSRGSFTLGNYTSYSEATYDRHAFTYLPGETDRMAFPALLVDRDAGQVITSHSELRQYEVVGKQLPASAQLRDAGAVFPANAPAPAASQNRSFIDGDTVWYVRDGQVWSSRWQNPATVLGPF